MKNIDYVGTEVNELKIIGYFVDGDGQNRRPRFRCLCVCGKIFEPRTETIKNGTTKSCGCKTSELLSASHTLENDAAIINKIYYNYKQTAARKEIDFNLSLEEFIPLLSLNCVYCGRSPQLSIFSGSEKYKRKEKRFAYNGIDRINNDLGYAVDNCITCCSNCNRAKSDLPLEDFLSWIQDIVRFSAQKQSFQVSA